MEPKVVVTDLDGTAVASPSQKIVSSRLLLATDRLKSTGVKVCAATGRSVSFSKPVIESMKLEDPCIVAGGTKIIDPKTYEELWSCSLSVDAAKEVLSIAKKLSYGFLWNDSTEDDYLNGGWNLNERELPNPEEVYFFEICFVPHDEVPYILEKFAHIESLALTVVVAQRPGTNDIHITNKSATKEHAIAQLSRMLNIPTSDMIGIGDGHNDLHLFAAVGWKVAMGNAVDELKEIADELIKDVEDDGLAEYFERLTRRLSNEI